MWTKLRNNKITTSSMSYEMDGSFAAVDWAPLLDTKAIHFIAEEDLDLTS